MLAGSPQGVYLRLSGLPKRERLWAFDFHTAIVYHIGKRIHVIIRMIHSPIPSFSTLSPHIKQRRLQQAVSLLRHRYGKQIVLRAIAAFACGSPTLHQVTSRLVDVAAASHL
jgi:hypothetical protein